MLDTLDADLAGTPESLTADLAALSRRSGGSGWRPADGRAIVAS
ncbi:MAG: hypothetical protein R3C32_04940 [Chloroflexota bacterium]